MKLAQFVYIINSLNPVDFEKKKKKIEQSVRESSHFKLKICIPYLCNTVCIYGQIFMKLAQFIYIINSFKPIDLNKIWQSVRGK